MAPRPGRLLYFVASRIAVILIAGGIVVWFYFARPSYDSLGSVVVGWGIIVWLGAVQSDIINAHSPARGEGKNKNLTATSLICPSCYYVAAIPVDLEGKSPAHIAPSRPA